MKLKPYPKYKDSGIEWLGKVPEGWEIKRLRYLISRNDGGVWGNDTINDEGDIVLRSTEVNINGSWSIQEPAFRKLSASEKKKALLEFGDILVTKSSGSKEHIGKSAYVDKEIAELKACFSNFMQRLRTIDKYFGKFIYYILNNHIGREQMNFLGQTTTGLINLNGSVLGEIKIAYPSKEDATKLIDFLDHKTTKIDELIKKNERLIEILKEKRHAIISHAVTKGLDPNVKMKDSGIEWLGEIPEGWEVRRLKRIARLEYGSSLREEAREEGSVPVYGSNGIVGEHSKSITDKPVIIIGRKGSYGKVSYSDVPCFPIDTTYYIDSNLTKENIRWLYYILSSIALDEITFDTGVPGLSREFAYTKIVPFPSKNEQTTIANFLDQKTAQIDNLTQKILSQIESLKEYRQALISNVVTGKVRVTGLS